MAGQNDNAVLADLDSIRGALTFDQVQVVFAKIGQGEPRDGDFELTLGMGVALEIKEDVVGFSLALQSETDALVLEIVAMIVYRSSPDLTFDRDALVEFADAFALVDGFPYFRQKVDATLAIADLPPLKLPFPDAGGLFSPLAQDPRRVLRPGDVVNAS